MNKFEGILQMPLKEFSNMVFHIVKKFDTLQEFEDFLNQEVPPELEEPLKEALQVLQCSGNN